MKIRFNHSLQGNTLVLTLVTAGILGFLLVAYLSLVRSQNISNMRSQSWNQAIPVIEAGIEDAMTHLNEHGLTNLYCDSWSDLGGIYYMKRYVGNNYYLVTISNFYAGQTNLPVIESRGFVTMPTLMIETPVLGAAGVTMPSADGTASFLGRGVRVVAKRDWLFAKGMVAKGQIDLKGNNITSDSFDSSDSLASTGGQYDITKRKANGDIATNSGLTNSLNIGNANVWGRVSTGPKGSVQIGPGGSVGSAAWQIARRKGVEPGYATDDMNVDFPDVDPPFTGGYITPSAGTNEGVRYEYLLDSCANYQLDTLTLGADQRLYVKSNANAVLYVLGNVSLSGQAAIYVAPGASLKLYVGGGIADLQGNGVINKGGNATNFIYFGMQSNTNLDLGGNAAFVGVIYAPYANMTLNGGGADTTWNFTGASITATVNLNGHFNFHYDEALAKYGPFRRYIVTRWDEMPPHEVAGSLIDASPRNILR